MGAEEVLDFWFGPLTQGELPTEGTLKRWFRGGAAFDREIRERFEPDLAVALRGECEAWASTPRGRLALVIALDQFTRNTYRGTAAAFSGDESALAHALAAVEAREDERLRSVERYFLYMPFEHAEDLVMQERACSAFERLVAHAPEAVERICRGGLDWARRHKRVIERFGRFPGRNAALGRESTAEELEFLAAHPAGF